MNGRRCKSDDQLRYGQLCALWNARDKLRRMNEKKGPAMTKTEIAEKVDQLLHDADRKRSGAAMARMMRDPEGADELGTEATGLVLEAERIDPNRGSPAWGEFRREGGQVQ